VRDDAIVNKITSVERCLQRVREEYRDEPARLDDHTVQDAVVLNLQRACETCIDLAMHLVARERLGDFEAFCRAAVARET
jgi:uncharacterized protein YutE (UPF0331/DUF86 family)